MRVVSYSRSLPGRDAMAHIRLIAPFREAGFQLIDGFKDGRLTPKCILDADVVVIQREFPQQYDSYQKIVETAKHRGVPVIFDLDDFLFGLHSGHPDRLSHVFTPALVPMFQAMLEADLVTVPTLFLKEAIASFNDNVAILPNYLDDRLWDIKPVAKKTREDVVVLGYMGGHSHQPDLEYIEPVLKNVLAQYPGKVKLCFVGTQPPDGLRNAPQVEWIPYVTTVYSEFVEFFQTQSFDIALAPLIDTFFNRCKSPLKFLEYAAIGAVGIFSNLPPYADVVSHNENGLLASSLDEWDDCLGCLIENPDLRFRLVKNAQKLVSQFWLLSQNAHHWSDIYKTVITGMSHRPKIHSTLSFINHQIQETLAEVEDYREQQEQWKAQLLNLQSQVRYLQDEKQALQEQHDHLKDQIDAIYRSRGWRVLVALQKIRQRIAPPGSIRAIWLERALHILFPNH